MVAMENGPFAEVIYHPKKMVVEPTMFHKKMSDCQKGFFIPSIDILREYPIEIHCLWWFPKS